MNNTKILVTGGTGFLGENLYAHLLKCGYQSENIYYDFYDQFPYDGVDFSDPIQTDHIINHYKPDIVINLAAQVGGILKNISDPYGFLYNNVMIQSTVINACVKHKVKKVINLASSCMFPKDLPILKEEDLLQGSLEPTNLGYALAKIVGLKLGEYANKQFDSNIITLSPTNLYGPHSHFDLESSHALSALILKTYNCIKNNDDRIVVFGDGTAKREWLYVEDMCDAITFAIDNIEKPDTFFNVGVGYDISMNDLAMNVIACMKSKMNYTKDIHIVNDVSKPSGMQRKLLDVSKMKQLGWTAKTDFDNGLNKTIDWFLENEVNK